MEDINHIITSIMHIIENTWTTWGYVCISMVDMGIPGNDENLAAFEELKKNFMKFWLIILVVVVVWLVVNYFSNSINS